jgi:hypothetical protein
MVLVMLVLMQVLLLTATKLTAPGKTQPNHTLVCMSWVKRVRCSLQARA